MEVLVSLKIKRYNPDKVEEPHFQVFKVRARKDTTLLDALTYIKEHIDPTLTFRAFCRSQICGSCAVKVNGHPKLACRTRIIEEIKKFKTDTLLIEPLDGFAVIRDLVVDNEKSFEKLSELRAYLIPDPQIVPPEPSSESRVYPEEMKRFDKFTDCILCTSCYSICPSLKFYENYAGPFPFAKLARFALDPRDGLKEERGKIAAVFDVWKCLRCERCSDVCPKKTEPLRAVQRLREASINSGLKNLVGARYALAFYRHIYKTGYINEVLLPIQTSGLKSLLDDSKAFLRLVQRGKLPPPFVETVKDIESLRGLMETSHEIGM